ncbi:7681_t:CDS:2 [Diversispora eburnea]|uniref:7681_t:CDS:1 n=1 Tax=Diversispora eburnea TaxID=1213867 RepID=A0A9N8W8B6_9GLOM|nr:7681_t:CDS:2 [Diversispora eburnea]
MNEYNKTKYLESQIKSFNERPHKIRRDLWKPILAISGFSSYTSVIATNNIVRDKLLNYPKPADYLKLRRKERMKDDMDQLEKSVCSLCYALNKVVYTKGYEWDASSNLIIYWENPELKEVPTKVGLTWPKCVKHQKLLIKRGTIPLNQEFKVIQKPEEVREEIRKTRYLKSRRGRIESEKKEEKLKLMERLASIPKLREILEANARGRNQLNQFKMIDSINNKN